MHSQELFKQKLASHLLYQRLHFIKIKKCLHLAQLHFLPSHFLLPSQSNFQEETPLDPFQLDFQCSGNCAHQIWSPDFSIHPTPERIVYPFFFEGLFFLYSQTSLCPILMLSLWTFPVSSSSSSSSDCCLHAFFPSGSWHSSHTMASSGYPIHSENLATREPWLLNLYSQSKLCSWSADVFLICHWISYSHCKLNIIILPSPPFCSPPI